MPTFTYNDSPNRKPFEEPGTYKVTVIEYNFSTAQSSGNEMLQLTLETEHGVLVYDNLVFAEKAFWKVDTAIKAFFPSKGIPLPAKGSNFEIDADFAENGFMGATGTVELSKEAVQGKEGKFRNNVLAYLAPGESSPNKPATGGKKPEFKAAPKTPPKEVF